MSVLPTLLAPIPEEHLIAGMDICDREGKVAYGSRAFEVFEKADGLRDGIPLDVFIYPSWGSKFGPPKARWHGTYVGHVHSISGAHPDGMRFRPDTTAQYPDDNQGFWAIFYEMTGLRELSKGETLAMTRFRGFGTQKKLVSNYIPRGPVLVDVI